MLTSIQEYIHKALQNFDAISEERKKTLERISQFVQTRIDAGQMAELIYVCTHNSRRSHLGQIWGKTASAYFGISLVNTYSAGTEVTAFNPNAIRAVERAGFRVSKTIGDKNPRYEVYFDEDQDPIVCFSKTYEDASIPKEHLCAIMTCTEADGNCPFITGTELRVSCPYVDPKAFDGTPQQDEKYAERCFQIATECLYVFSTVKTVRP